MTIQPVVPTFSLSMHNLLAVQKKFDVLVCPAG